jgi:hypothetical protein
MMHGRKKLMFAVVPIASVYLFNGSMNASLRVAEAETVKTTGSLERTTADVEHADEKTPGENKNIIDRVFSPLDKAVTDINRDLNAGNGSAAGETDD